VKGAKIDAVYKYKLGDSHPVFKTKYHKAVPIQFSSTAPTVVFNTTQNTEDMEHILLRVF
jgi:hypothetical protein